MHVGLSSLPVNAEADFGNYMYNTADFNLLSKLCSCLLTKQPNEEGMKGPVAWQAPCCSSSQGSLKRLH